METLEIATADCVAEAKATGQTTATGPACIRFNRNWHVLQEIYDFIKKRKPESLTIMLKQMNGQEKADKFWELLETTQNRLIELQSMNYRVD